MNQRNKQWRNVITKNTVASSADSIVFQSPEVRIARMKKIFSEKAGENDLCAIAVKYFFDSDLDSDEAVEMAIQEFRKVVRTRSRERRKKLNYE